MSDLLSGFQTHVERSRSPRTARAYLAVVRAFAASLEMRGVAVPSEEDVASFLARPLADRRRRAASTHNHELAALRVLGRFATAHAFWASDPTREIAFVRGAPRDPAVLSVAELRRLFTVAAEIAADIDRARSLAILAILSQAGLRVHELVALEIEQVDFWTATLVAVKGKGGTVHDVPLNAATLSLLTDWLALRDTIARDNEPALFVSRLGRRTSVRTVQRMLVALRTVMGTAKHVTPHTLRHTTATLALTLGADLSTVGDLLRHANLNTTRHYLHLVDERRRNAVRTLEIGIPSEILSPYPDDTIPKPIDSAELRERRRNPLDVHEHLGDTSRAA